MKKKRLIILALALVALVVPFMDPKTHWPVVTHRQAIEANLPRFLPRVMKEGGKVEVGGVDEQLLQDVQQSFGGGFDEYAVRLGGVLTFTYNGRKQYVTGSQGRWTTLAHLNRAHVVTFDDGFVVIGEVPSRFQTQPRATTSQSALAEAYMAVTGGDPVKHNHVFHDGDGLYDVVFFDRFTYERRDLVDKLNLLWPEATRVLARGWKVGAPTLFVWGCCGFFLLFVAWTTPQQGSVQWVATPRRHPLPSAPRRSTRIRTRANPFLEQLTEMRGRCRDLNEAEAARFLQCIEALLKDKDCTRVQVDELEEGLRAARAARAIEVVDEVASLLSRYPSRFRGCDEQRFREGVEEIRRGGRCRLTKALHLLREVKSHIPSAV